MRVAIVGGGVSGLVTAYLLRRTHDVQLFEAADYLGGHTYTVPVEEEGRTLWIDMGFIVFNRRNYPLFDALLNELGVASEASDMSFSVRCERTGLEYKGSTLASLFAQRRNLVRPSFYRMLRGIVRFHRVAPALLEGEEDPTLREFLERHRFDGPFVENYLIPMTASIWSTDPARMWNFPARSLVEFLSNHGMLQVGDRPRWRVVSGGSKTYVEALRAALGERLVSNAPVLAARRLESGVEIEVGGHGKLEFDRLVLATHSDQSLKILSDPTPEEREVLGAIGFQDNEVVLHTDRSILPRRERAWASWNYHLGGPENGLVQMTYSMNILQNLEAKRQYCVTLNRTADIDPATILETRSMAHPQFTREAVAAQGRWQEISAERTLFCGAYWGHGFHGVGVRSAHRVAKTLGGGKL